MDILMTAIMGAIANLAASSIKDAYEALKLALARKFGVNSDLNKAVNSLEQKPDSPGRKQTLEEEIDHTQAHKDPEIYGLAQALLEKLDQQASVSQAGTKISQKAGKNSTQIGQVGRDVNINKK